jgi:hypothetical protein
MRRQPVLIIATRRSAEMSLVIVLVIMFFVSCTSPQPSQPAASESPSSIKGEVYTIGERISFAQGGNGLKYAASGWSVAEPWGTWTEGSASVVGLKLSEIPNRDMVLSIEGRAFLADKHPVQDIEVQVNKHLVETLRYELPAGADHDTRVITIPQSFIQEKQGLLIIEFKIKNPKSPAEVGYNTDPRVLGLAVFSLRLH